MLEEKTESCKLSSDCHVHACTRILTCVHTHTYTHAPTLFFLNKNKVLYKNIALEH